MAFLAFGAALLIFAWTPPGSVRRAYTLVRSSLGAVTTLSVFGHDTGPTVRVGETTIPNGVFYLPPTFRSLDGRYDLVVHFHGQPGLVEESFAIAHVNAALVVFNIGLGTGAYDQYVAEPATFVALLARVQDELAHRGLEHPHLGRVALTAWSAGSGAVSRLLETGVVGDSLDAVIVLDGLYSSYDAFHHVDGLRLVPFVALAKQAMVNERLFTLTHSEVETFTYPSTRETADALLRELGLERTKGGTSPEWPAFTEDHAVRKDKIPPLEPTSECHAGSFRVRGFSGGTKEAHMAHLIYMATLALPDLANRWNLSNGANLRAY